MKDAESHRFSFDLDIDSFDIILQNGTMYIKLKTRKEHYDKKFEFNQMHALNSQIFTDGILRPSPTDGWPDGSFEPSGPPRFSKILIF